MAHQFTPIRVPLLEISGKVESSKSIEGLPWGLKAVSEVEIHESLERPEQHFALEVPNIFGESAKADKALGIFGYGNNEKALQDVYVLGLQEQQPFVCQVIKNEAKPKTQDSNKRLESSGRVKSRRKSFMTPTPLHIPDSRVSPIPDSSHEMIYFRNLEKKETLKIVSSREVVWIYPLLFIMNSSE